MRTKNFPARLNARRIRALNRLDIHTFPIEASILTDRIVPESVARTVRTKKDRSAKAKMRTA